MKISPRFLIFLIVFVNFLGYGIIFPLLPFITIEYGGNPLLSGILVGIFALMQVIAMPILGRLSDRFGRRPLLLFSLWGTLVSFLIMAATHSLFWLFVARIIDGVSGGNLSIAQAYIADVTNRKERTGAMGIILAALSLGFIFGPILGGLLVGIHLSAPFYMAALITLFSIVLTYFYLPESLPKKEISYEKKHFNFLQFLLHTPSSLFLLYLMTLILLWIQSGYFTILPLFGSDVLRVSIVHMSFLLAYGGILAAFIQGFAIKKTLVFISEKKLFFIGSVLALTGMSILTFSVSLPLFFVGLTLFSIGNSYLVPLIQGIASKKSSEHEQGGNLGILQSFGAIGRILGPIVGGYIYQGNPVNPAIMGVILLLFVLILGFKI